MKFNNVSDPDDLLPQTTIERQKYEARRGATEERCCSDPLTKAGWLRHQDTEASSTHFGPPKSISRSRLPVSKWEVDVIPVEP